MKVIYLILILLVLLGGVALVTVLITPSKEKSADTYPVHPYTEIVNPSGFVNTNGITIGELVGKKVILVEFLTYSCINCQRTFPYIISWYDKYQDEGLEIIGIHTPEFAFEQDINNVRAAMQEFGIKYPIVLDNEYATWQSYGNRYWPRKYLIDIHGNVVYDHIGEGAYDETEAKIQELLTERAQVLGIEAGPDTRAGNTAEVVGETPSAESPETYFGSFRNEYLANGTQGKEGTQTFSVPATLLPNKLYLGGTWAIEAQAARSVSDSTVVYKYRAKNVYIVGSADAATEVEVWQDGTLVPPEARGADVGEEGTVTIQESKLYKLIHNETLGEHTLELKVKGSGLRFYAFTFG